MFSASFSSVPVDIQPPSAALIAVYAVLLSKLYFVEVRMPFAALLVLEILEQVPAKESSEKARIKKKRSVNKFFINFCFRF